MNKEIACFQGRTLVTKAKVILIWGGGVIQTQIVLKKKKRGKKLLMSCNWSVFSRDTEPTRQIKRQKEIDDIKTDVR